MSKSVINSAEEYRLLIDHDLLGLIREAIALEKSYINSKAYSNKRCELENRLCDLYQEIGWSVVYDMKECPF